MRKGLRNKQPRTAPEGWSDADDAHGAGDGAPDKEGERDVDVLCDVLREVALARKDDLRGPDDKVRVCRETGVLRGAAGLHGAHVPHEARCCVKARVAHNHARTARAAAVGRRRGHQRCLAEAVRQRVVQLQRHRLPCRRLHQLHKRIVVCLLFGDGVG